MRLDIKDHQRSSKIHKLHLIGFSPGHDAFCFHRFPLRGLSFASQLLNRLAFVVPPTCDPTWIGSKSQESHIKIVASPCLKISCTQLSTLWRCLTLYDCLWMEYFHNVHHVFSCFGFWWYRIRRSLRAMFLLRLDSTASSTKSSECTKALAWATPSRIRSNAHKFWSDLCWSRIKKKTTGQILMMMQ